MTMFFLNLPTTDVARASAFYSALGWAKNEQFSDDSTTSHVVSDALVVMALSHDKFQSFSKRPIPAPDAGLAAIYCLSADSRDAVDALCAKAEAAGGTLLEEPQDHGFMYGRSFANPDGQAFEVMWMDPAAIAGGEMPEVEHA